MDPQVNEICLSTAPWATSTFWSQTVYRRAHMYIKVHSACLNSSLFILDSIQCREHSFSCPNDSESCQFSPTPLRELARPFPHLPMPIFSLLLLFLRSYIFNVPAIIATCPWMIFLPYPPNIPYACLAYENRQRQKIVLAASLNNAALGCVTNTFSSVTCTFWRR